MKRIVFIIFGIFLTAIIGISAVTKATAVSGPSPRPPDSTGSALTKIAPPVRITMLLDRTEAQNNSLQVRLQIDSSIPAKDIRVIWESLQNITPVSDNARQSLLQFEDAQHAELVYNLAIETGENQILTVSAIGQTQAGKPVGSRISKLLAVKGNQYSLEKVPEKPTNNRLKAYQFSPTSKEPQEKANITRDYTHIDQKPHTVKEETPVSDLSATNITVRGCWVYLDKDNVERELPWVRVEIWDEGTPNSPLRTLHASLNGCFITDVSSNRG